MSLEGGVTLLEHWGVDAEVQTGNIDDLRAMLDQGTPIIIGLDSDDLYGLGDQPFADDFVAGHAVVITGIDDEAGLVYINDPGFPDGAGVAVSIEDFEDAWIDGGNSMIVADVDGDAALDTAVDTAADTAVEGAAGGAEQGSDRAAELSLIDLVLIPLRLVVR
ncbi:MAG: papain-like cysteine protease family protein [Ilumatobacteraceae bacterium]